MNKLMDIIQDYENIQKLFPGRMSCNILEKKTDCVITEEVIYISKFSIQIRSKSLHKKISQNILETTIIDGPLKNSIINVKFEPLSKGTKVSITATLKLSIKYRLLHPFIKKRYQELTTGFLYQINDIAIVTSSRSWKDCLVSNGDALLLSDYFDGVKLYGWWLCTLRSCFIDDDYGFLPVLNKTVIDIGANVGDTTLYFARKGASKIISLEPYPIMAKWTIMNIEKNELDNVTVLQVGCAGESKTMTIDPKISNVGAILEEYDNGTKIKLTTLASIVNNFNINSGILKMNCEGCEYDVIRSSSTVTLKKFSHILIAYHNGYVDLERKLLESNFKLQIKQHPLYRDQGWILAQNSDPQ